ncbi:ABC transporter ATP-binding protein [Paenibacillus ihumii]|uniref:ABC transporter ATP-binding protein n=1 Tax=Paenibacillus ihumii TaxID=687436 RepID=UPI0006D81BC9|nr:ABC transporter ATP-binding protein [Paenibacillus ihumii]
MNITVFEAKGLTKQYGAAFALQDINMTVRAGDIYGVIGENGAGKTTLMRIIGGLVHPTSGELSLFGKSNKRELHLVRRQIGFLIEMPALYPNLNAEENLTFYCHIYGINDPKRIPDVLQAVNLSNVGNKKILDYSLGMRQRLGLAVALLNKPKFLVLDEPINGLDPSGIMEVRKILENLAKEKRVSILISSHILSELQLLATKFGFIHKGRMIKEISADELLKSAEKQICIRTTNLEETAQILKDELQIEFITISEVGEIQISKKNVDMEKLMSVLLQKGIQIQGINLSTPNLENYYLALIRGSKS